LRSTKESIVIDFSLSTDQEQLLRDQVIDRDRPGSVLRDFEMLLDYVGERGIKAAGKYNLLPMDAIAPLDERLARPLRLPLERPLLKSHPYLQGLHLLLRASSLGRVEGSGAKARLSVDAEVLAAWRALNATEQYFTLLEAWLRFGRPEMVGEKGGGWPGSFLMSCVTDYRNLPASGQHFDLQRPTDVYLLGIGRQFYLLALLDLFGVMEVEHPSVPVKPWCPAGVMHRPFGDALVALLAQSVLQSGGDVDEEEPEDANCFGKWQPLLQPYFPEWRDNLKLPETPAHAGTYVFKVALGDVWRRIAISAEATLDELAGAILQSVEFDFDHLYEFVFRDRFGAQVRAVHPACDEPPFTPEIDIGTLPLEPGQSMQFTYDFGDCWQFGVKLESIEETKKGPRTPKVLAKHGKAPEQYPSWD
jgi:hypothetical protein